MSGGSYDYLYLDMSNGGLEKFERWSEQLVEDLAEVASNLRAGQVEVFSPTRGPYPNPDAAADAVDATRARCAAIAAEIRALGDKVAALASVARAAEWSRSCDTGPDDVANACVALSGWARVTPAGAEIRAGGDVLCKACGLEYRRHPNTGDRDWNGDPYLRRLCDGAVVKL